MIDDGFRLFPESASTVSGDVDALFAFLLIVSAIMTLGIAGTIVFFSIRYRRGSRANREGVVDHSTLLEITWIGIPFLITMVIFVWGARVYMRQSTPPDNAMELRAVGKQWMWKFQHPDGRREINELHVPLGQPMRLTMISQDVIHSLYIPAFRIKHDVLPGRYTGIWFEPTRLGEYHLFCAEYCGTQHSLMRGRVVVLEPAEYQAWLAGTRARLSPRESGGKLFDEMRCAVCHRGGGQSARCPPLENLYGSQVELTSGQTLIADEAYLRESILRADAKIVKGYQAVMPPFERQISEEGVSDLIAYIKSLSTQQPRNTAP